MTLTDQRIVTYGAALLGAAVYGFCGLCLRKKQRIESVLMFGLMCAAAVTGIYIVAGAFEQANSDNALYCGVLGAGLSIVTAQEAANKIRALFAKKVTTNKAESTTSE